MTRTVTFVAAAFAAGCSKKGAPDIPVIPPPFHLSSATIDGQPAASVRYNTATAPLIRLSFTTAIDRPSASGALLFTSDAGSPVAFTPSFENGDSTILVQPSTPLLFITGYGLKLSTTLRSHDQAILATADSLHFITTLDSTG